ALETVAKMFPVAADTDQEIETGLAEMRRQISFYGSTPAYKGVFEPHRRHALPPRPHAPSKDGKWDEMAQSLPQEVVDAFVIYGTPEEVVDKTKALYGGKIDRTSLSFEVKDPDRRRELIARMKA